MAARSQSILPAPTGELIGRVGTVAEVCDLLKTRRLVTLVGTGGIGKTRVSLEVGRVLHRGFADGVWFIDFAPLTDGALIDGKLAAEMGIADSGERPIRLAVTESLKRRRMLLLLDTCEHVIDAAAQLVEAILLAAPDVYIVTTSREPLRIACETIFHVPSLTYPKHKQQDVPLTNVSQFSAMTLFAERAQAVDQIFTLSQDDVPFVAEICRRVEGIALGVELAAACVRTFSVANLAQRLDMTLPILTRGSRTGSAHHRTMRALIDWSYGLLSSEERRLLHRVAIFVDGWTLDAAEAVCSDDSMRAEQVVPAIGACWSKDEAVREALKALSAHS